MADGMNSSRRGLATKGVAAFVALAFATASVGTTSVAFAQGSKATAKPAGTTAKPAGTTAKPGNNLPSAADKKKAGAAFKKGKELFDKSQWKEARDEFKQAEEIIPAGAAEFYIARCSEELGESSEAASWYDKAISSGKLKPELETDAKARLSALKTKPAKVTVSSDPSGASIWLDGKDTGKKTPSDIDVPPGTHKISLQAAGKKQSDQDVEVAAFTGATVNAKLEDAPTAVAEDPFAKKDPNPPVTPATTTATTSTTVASDTGGKRDMTWVYITGAGAIIGLGVGTAFGLKALSDKKDYDANPTRDTRDKGTRDALIADMGFGIGITLAVTSLVLVLSSGSSSETASIDKPKISFAPMVAGMSTGKPSMAGAAAAFHF